MKLIKVNHSKMDTIFMNSKNGKTSDAHKLILNVPEKIYLKCSDNYVALSNLTLKIIKT